MDWQVKALKDDAYAGRVFTDLVKRLLDDPQFARELVFSDDTQAQDQLLQTFLELNRTELSETERAAVLQALVDLRDNTDHTNLERLHNLVDPEAGHVQQPI